MVEVEEVEVVEEEVEVMEEEGGGGGAPPESGAHVDVDALCGEEAAHAGAEVPPAGQAGGLQLFKKYVFLSLFCDFFGVGRGLL